MNLEQVLNIKWDTFIPIVAAVVMGGLIGLEREIHRKSAGLRTNILICMGAALFTHIALGFETDAAKMLAGVITGVGFIGAGAVLRDRASVHGVTTAATIWLVTGIGIACGMGMYVIAMGITLITLVVLFGLSPLDQKIHHPKPVKHPPKE